MNSSEMPQEFPLVPELGVVEPWQSLFLLPARYTDLSRVVTSIPDIDPRSDRVLFRGALVEKIGYTAERALTPKANPAMLGLVLTDGAGQITCEAYRASDWKGVSVGDSVTVHARVKRSSARGLYLASPEIVAQQARPRVEYRGIPGKVAGERIHASVRAAMADSRVLATAEAWFLSQRPELSALVRKHWGAVDSLFRALHTPDSVADGRRALAIARRLCMAEVRRKARLSRPEPVALPPVPQLRRAVWQALKHQPETISAGQLEALHVAVPALAGNRPVRVLLNGDVGSGKTLVFLGIVVGFAALGRYSAVMAPNENVARQLHRQMTRRFPQVPTRYVAGGVTEGPEDALVWIGTTALLFATHPSFALVVVDEQHKFSREQRESLLDARTHIIEASATPVPRSLALALFADSLLAQIASPPVNRHIRTHITTEDQRHIIAGIHRDVVRAGKRIIYLYAAVNASSKPSAAADEAAGVVELPTRNNPVGLRALRTAYDEMQKANPGQVAIVHGQMPAGEAERELDAFATGSKPILMASTAIEVGTDVPDIALVVVNNPERFGISQLHQIRGRLARNGGAGDFIMHVKRTLPKATMLRLQAVQRCHDGFQLAEEDLRQRGFGDVAGDMQVGVTETTFKLANLQPEDFLRPAK